VGRGAGSALLRAVRNHAPLVAGNARLVALAARRETPAPYRRMKRRICAFAMLRGTKRLMGVGVCALLLPRLAAAQDAAAPMRLEDAVHFALTRNERARISDLNVVVAEAAVERARAAFLPIVTAVGQDAQHAPYPAGSRAPDNIGTANLTVNQPILNASAFPLYGQAKNLADAQHAQNVDDKRLLAFNAASAFFTVLQAQAVVTAARRQVDNAKANLADTQARAQAQLTSSNDVTRAQIDMAGAQRELESDKGALDNQLVQLAFTINAAVPSAGLTPPQATFGAAEQPLGAPEPLVRLALGRRPDVLASKYSASAAHDFAAEPLLRLVPTLGVQGQASATTNTATTGRWNDESVTATLTWTLYDAGVRCADKHSRDAQAEISDLNVQQLIRSVDAQVRAAAALLASAQQAFHAADDAMKSARQSADETSILYRQGLAKAIELVDANDSRFTAEVNYASAQYGMAQAYLALRQALGLDPLGTELK
jgi:outer membrane protein TolC